MCTEVFSISIKIFINPSRKTLDIVAARANLSFSKLDRAKIGARAKKWDKGEGVMDGSFFSSENTARLLRRR